MPDDKRLLDYFIQHTDGRFMELREEMSAQHRGLSRKIDRLRTFGIVVVVLCLAASPQGERLFEALPKLLEVAMAAGH